MKLRHKIEVSQPVHLPDENNSTLPDVSSREQRFESGEQLLEREINSATLGEDLIYFLRVFLFLGVGDLSLAQANCAAVGWLAGMLQDGQHARLWTDSMHGSG